MLEQLAEEELRHWDQGSLSPQLTSPFTTPAKYVYSNRRSADVPVGTAIALDPTCVIAPATDSVIAPATDSAIDSHAVAATDAAPTSVIAPATVNVPRKV